MEICAVFSISATSDCFSKMACWKRSKAFAHAWRLAISFSTQVKSVMFGRNWLMK